MATKRFAAAAAVLFLMAAGCADNNSKEECTEPEVHPLGFNPEAYIPDTTIIRNGETFTGLLTRLGFDSGKAYAMVQACRDTFDARRIVAGNKVIAYRDTSSGERLEYIVYTNDRIKSTIFKCADSLCAWTYSKPVINERKTVDVTIRNSLWNDLIEQGASPMLVMELADIYAWTVNFFGLQEGDRFRAVYYQRLVDDEVIAIDSVAFSLYDSGNFHAYAVRFDQHDGGNKYWNEKGESMRKAFLKAPLRYSRISSRFTYHRKHPISGKVRPHTGVDYAAPSGTPVQSIGDGTVTLCGWDSKGGGNRIKIKHMNGYETCYMHLKGFAKGIRTGAHVSQGQTIGYVGSTGSSTGPHLDFRVWKDRTPIDPLKMISPPSAPLNKENTDSLSVLLASYRNELGIE